MATKRRPYTCWTNSPTKAIAQKTKTMSGRNTSTARSPRRATATAAVTPASAPTRSPMKATNGDHGNQWSETARATDGNTSAANGIKSRTAHQPSGV